MDSDFVSCNVCVGRATGWRGWLADLVCQYTGHILWRTGGSAGESKREFTLKRGVLSALF